MNPFVPDFEMDEDFSIPNSSAPLGQGNHHSEEELMELLWQNGQVVMQSQNERSLKRSQIVDAVIPAEQSAAREIRQEEESTTHLFMQEDDMASWLHYSIDESSFDRDLYADLVYPAPSAPIAPPSRTAPVSDVRTTDVRIPPPFAAAASRSQIPPPRLADVEQPARFQNFVHLRANGRIEPGQSARDVVDSSETPATVASESIGSHVAGSTTKVAGASASMSGTAAAGASSAADGVRETGPCELTLMSSPDGSEASVSASAEPVHEPPPTAEDRKRKGREADVDDTDCPSEDVEFESPDGERQIRGLTSSKRGRAAEVHNLSERRRRDRINEKMRALQELIPRCNKSDKASMLDEAIEYLKSLQLQVQLMSMGCGVVPMMFPQRYMQPMGVAMGMGMGMEMSMSRPVMPFPPVLAGSAFPTSAGAAHLGPRFHMPAFHMPSVPLPDPSRIQANSWSDPALNSLGTQNPNHPRMPNCPAPYQQYFSLQQTQVPLPQNQAAMQPSSSREVENHENLQSG